MPRGIPRSYLETDTTLASNSDLKVPSTKAVRAYIAAAGGGSVTLETAIGVVNGINRDFVFVGTPIAIFRNGVLQRSDEYEIIEPTTVRLILAPSNGEITGLTQ